MHIIHYYDAKKFEILYDVSKKKKIDKYLLYCIDNKLYVNYIAMRKDDVLNTIINHRNYNNSLITYYDIFAKYTCTYYIGIPITACCAGTR